MKTVNVDLSTLVPKGKIRSEVTNGILKMTTTRVIYEYVITSCPYKVVK